MPARSALAALCGALLAASAPAADACPFCNAQGTTLATEFATADLIVVASVVSSTRDADDFTKSTTVVKVEKLLKPHPAFAKATTLTLQRYIPKGEPGRENQYLLFCYVNGDAADGPVAAVASAAVYAEFRNAKVDAYRGEDLPAGSKLPGYLEQTQKLQEKTTADRLRFYFDHLESNELFVSTDAFTEWGYAPYKEVRAVAEKLPPETLLKWLRDPNTLGSRLGLYGMLLGHCGKPAHAAELRKLLDDPDNRYSLGLDGLLAGYTVLDPAGGWDYVLGLIADRKKNFGTRYAALRTVRFFHDDRPEVIPEAKRLAAVKLLVEQDDIADMVIDDLRKWKMWDQIGYVLGFADKESHNVGIVKRAMLKFALQAAAATNDAAAVAYVEKVRAADPKRVKQAEELLADEAPRPPRKSG